ncbi:hypothetical protein C0J52_11156 [Blattella germanica]|nr:hypothetical protein C0J52_11156 [Blattella germanica]
MLCFLQALSVIWDSKVQENAVIIIVSGGTLEAWTSPALPYLQANHSTLQSLENITSSIETEVARGITDDEASWIGSLAAIGALIGALPTGPLADKFGRRVVLLGLTLPFSVLLLYTARFIMGFAAGAAMVAVSLYNEEIAETKLRGELGSYLDLALTVGILYVYAIGAFVPYIWLCIAGAIVPILFAITFFWMPESPVFLLSKGRKIEAEKSLRWFRNVEKLDSPAIYMELREMEGSIKKPSVRCELCDRPTSKFVALKRCLSTISYSSPTCKTVFLVIGLMLGQQLSGINAVIFYTVDIFQAAGSTLSPYYCTLIVGVVQVISTYIAALLMDRLGRRVLLLTSGFGMAISLLILTVFFYFKETGVELSDWNWLPLASLNVYIVAFCIGFGPIPWFMVVELSTNETKGWMSSLGVSVNWLMVFVMTKVFILMLKGLGQAVSYGILCGLCAFSAIFVLVILLYTARFIMGFATGAAMVAVSLYNEEIAETNLRGELGSYLDLALAIGILYIYAIGAFVPYIWLCIAGAIVPVLFAITFFWMPESPVFLLSKGRTIEAEKSLRWFRNVGKLDSPDIYMELREMESSINKVASTSYEQNNTSKFVALKCLSTISYSSPTCKTVFLVIGLMSGQQLSGINAVIFYTVDIFQAAGSTLSPYYCTLIVGVVQVIFTYIAALLMERLGRRILLLVSGLGMASALLVLTVFFYIKETSVYISDWNWIPLASLIVYIVAFCVGFGPIPWFMVVELSTNETKGWMSSLGVSVNWLMVFVMTKVFILMLKGLGQAMSYGILCGLCVFSAMFVLFFVPETKDGVVRDYDRLKLSVMSLTEEQDSGLVRRRSRWTQHLAACLAAVACVCAGSLEGWTSAAIPYLQSNCSLASEPEGITDDEASWIGSLAPLGSLFGALPAGYLADRFGRRTILLVLSFPIVLGWVMIILAHKMVVIIYVARFILGFSNGAGTVVVVLYIEEIAETTIRGELCTYLDLALSVGILYMYSVGAFFPYLWQCVSAAVIPIVYLISFFWMPESPMYLISKGKTVEAEKCLRWLRNSDRLECPNIRKELEEMEVFVKKHNYTIEYKQSKMNSMKKSFERTFENLLFWKIISIVFGLMVFQQLSGINAVIFYTVDIFQAAGSTLSPYYCTLIVGFVQLVSTYFSALLMDRLGRRLLLFTSGIGLTISLLTMSVFLYFKERDYDVIGWTWIPLAALIVYSIAYCVGFGPIPWFIMVELASAETKGLVSSLGVSANWLVGFLVTKVFTLMLHKIGQSFTYGILSLFCVFGLGFVALYVPETKGKSREEIQSALSNNTKKNYLEVDVNCGERIIHHYPVANWCFQHVSHKTTLGGMCSGSIMGWTSPALPYLQEPYNISNNSVQDISDDEASWIGSLAPLGITVVTPLYCEEIAEDNVRGALGVYLDLMVTVGIFWAYLVGAFDQYLWLSICSCALPIIFGTSFAWMPESPVYLLSRGKHYKAKESLHWLRGGDHIPQYDVQPELCRMQRLLNESAKISCNPDSQLNCKNMLVSLSWSSPTIKALRIIFGLMFFQQMSGINAVVFYTVDIFQNAGGSWSPKTATIVVGLVQVIATFFPSLIVEIIGRRVLLILSISCMSICLGGVSLHSYIQQSQVHTDQGMEGFIPVILIALYTIMFSIGFGPLPWFMMAELVPPEAKGWASSMSVCLNWALVFAVTNMFPNLMTDLGPAGTYGLLAVICAIGTVFVFASVPETQGKTREEIQLYLQGSKFKIWYFKGDTLYKIYIMAQSNIGAAIKIDVQRPN